MSRHMKHFAPKKSTNYIDENIDMLEHIYNKQIVPFITVNKLRMITFEEFKNFTIKHTRV